jgi:hypothetical protein
MTGGWAPPENQGKGDYQTDARSNNEWQQSRKAVRYRGFDCRRENPKLRDVYHDKQYQARLRDGRSSSAGVTVNGPWLGLIRRALH